MQRVTNLFPDTEIDWKAYMQEVEGVVNGTWDYYQLKGDTGPLVYPAGFVYVFMGLYYLSNAGTNIRLAQYVFAVMYIVMVFLVIRLYDRSYKVPPYVLIFLCCTSYRIHSVFVLRLFNDPVALLFVYIALNCFMDHRWRLGSFFYSLGVSIKMNVLLFSPALLLIYISCLGMKETVVNLGICAGVQLILAAPFLLANPVAYMERSFDLGRVFFHQWTVNWRFLPEDIFVSRSFHLALLLLHILVLVVFAKNVWLRILKNYPVLVGHGGLPYACQLLFLPLFTANFIGIVFARSLHYQFYVWYYHSIPYLLWSTSYPTVLRLLLFGIIEMSWNTYPSTDFSSAALHFSHVVILIGLWRNQPPLSAAVEEMGKSAQLNDFNAKLSELVQDAVNEPGAEANPEPVVVKQSANKKNPDGVVNLKNRKRR
ncbi:unnamed protein product [Notodromas monacha]|uniref:dolichyl-P-Man:Man5GlcNAc2-PP-dolichol alpha-1,3-mannosyltransferase n=1 Tax=Notodromas monacha TaxID=399045 RepID=A0A7R9BL46_9CRUS|nr:unnamed protein product [Notodromas monacha]CAG0915995.1 unnamed protein product [Notodromas monacha]